MQHGQKTRTLNSLLRLEKMTIYQSIVELIEGYDPKSWQINKNIEKMAMMEPESAEYHCPTISQTKTSEGTHKQYTRLPKEQKSGN